MPQPAAGPEHRNGMKASGHSLPTDVRKRMQANRPRRSGFRRCGRPICSVSRHNVVWPSEYRVEVPLWGPVHLACYPTEAQLASLRRMAAMQRAAASFALHMAQMHTGFTNVAKAMQALNTQLARKDDA